MDKIQLTSNIDLQSDLSKVDQIIDMAKTRAIEIFLIPDNYLKNPLEFLPDQNPSDQFQVLNEQKAQEIGQYFLKRSICQIQVHYPWQFPILAQGGGVMSHTIEFCDIILDQSKAKSLSINYHNVMQFPDPSSFSGSERTEVLEGFEAATKTLQKIKTSLKSNCLLVVENDPLFGTNPKTSHLVDIIAEDFAGRQAVDGITLDVAHAWTVIEGFKRDRKVESLEWVKRQYNGIPESAQSIENYIKIVAAKLRWIHICDEPSPYEHTGSHIGDGAIDFKEIFQLLNKYLDHPVPATIEISDNHKPEGWKKIIEHDYPLLKNMLG